MAPGDPPSSAPNSPQRRKGAWLCLEPEDTTDPVPHSAADSIHCEGVSLVGVSVRGRLHAHRGRWREDAFALGRADAWAVACVADGAGSRPLARVGAQVAAQAALTAFQQVSDGDPEDASVQKHLCARLTNSMLAAREALEKEAEMRTCDISDLGTTLLVAAFARTPPADLLGWIGLGDGLIAAKTIDGVSKVLHDEDHGTYAGETRFITSRDFSASVTGRAQAIAFPQGLRAVVLSTDGVADDFFPVAERVTELFDADAIPRLKDPDGAPLPGLLPLLVGEAESPTDRLLHWLAYEARGSDDDRSLVLLLTDTDHGDRPT